MSVRNAFLTDRSSRLTPRSSWFLRALSIPYGLVTQCRNACYERGWLPQNRLPCRVVSIGNLTVGGTGKTPVTILVTEALLSAGHRVAVLSRGYRRRSRAPYVLVSDGNKILAGPDEAGDEPCLIARRCPRAVVAVGADRYQLGQWVLAQFALDCVVLDDGFQHRALYRDVDLLLVDSTDVQGFHGLLPGGRLREPVSSAARASALLVTRVERSDDAEPILSMIRQATGRTLPLILIRFVPLGFINVGDGGRASVDELTGRAGVIFSGIANAGAFRGTVLGQGLTVVDEVIFADHHAYTRADVETLRKRAEQAGASVLVTTEKDAVKLQPLLPPGLPVLAVQLETQIIEGRERLEQLLAMSDER